MQEKTGGQRKVHIDLLRILACFGVVVLHTSALYWYYLPVESVDWLVCNAYDALSGFGVPVFVMVSGMLFLGREGEVDIKRLYRGNILRLAVVYCIWNALYSVWGLKEYFGQPDFPWIDVVNGFIQGKYHLWFLPMLITIYMILPLLKTWTDHAPKKQLEYFLLLFILLRVGVDTLKILELPVSLEYAVDKIDVPLVCSFAGYFILGHYLDKYMPEGKKRLLVYAGGIVGAVGAVFVSTRMSVFYHGPNAEAFGNFSIFTLLTSVALFTFFNDIISKKSFSPKTEKWIGALSADTLGIYLIHLMLLEAGVLVSVTPLYLGTLKISPIFGVPVIAVLGFAVSMLITAVLRRIPVIGKYIC